MINVHGKLNLKYIFIKVALWIKGVSDLSPTAFLRHQGPCK